MRNLVAIVGVAVLAGGTGIVENGCGSSAGAPHKDAGPAPDAPTSSGGGAGSGGLTSTGGAGGTTKAECVTTTPCSGTGDPVCPAGYACNTRLDTPVCTMLACLPEGTTCAASTECPTGFDCVPAAGYVCRLPTPYAGVVLGTGTEGMVCGELYNVEGDSAEYMCGKGLLCRPGFGSDQKICTKSNSRPAEYPCGEDAICQTGLVCRGSCQTPFCSSTSAGCVAGWSCGAANVCECQPTTETCDGKDNDCNGIVDDEIAADADCAARLGPGHVCSEGKCQCAPPYTFFDVAISSAEASRANIAKCKMTIIDASRNILVKDSILVSILSVDSSGATYLTAGCALGLTHASVGTYAICSSHTSGSLTFQVDGTDDAGNVVQTGSSTQSATTYPPGLSVSVAMAPP